MKRKVYIRNNRQLKLIEIYKFPGIVMGKFIVTRNKILLNRSLVFKLIQKYSSVVTQI